MILETPSTLKDEIPEITKTSNFACSMNRDLETALTALSSTCNLSKNTRLFQEKLKLMNSNESNKVTSVFAVFVKPTFCCVKAKHKQTGLFRLSRTIP